MPSRILSHPTSRGHQGDAAVGLAETCRRMGYSYGHGRRLITQGRFPIPHLPRVGGTGNYKFSPHDIEAYLRTASIAEVLDRVVRHG